MFGILSSVAVPGAGGVYETYEDLIRDLNGRMEKDGYKVVKARSHSNRGADGNAPSDGIVRCDLVCDRGGRKYKSSATKHKTHTKKTDCPWRAKAVFRKVMQGWVLTIQCDQHNHEPGTPEPPTPPAANTNEDDEDREGEAEDDGPRPDPGTSTAMQLAGVADSVLRLTGDTFHQFKTEYRKLSQPERLGILSQLQLRIAAIYAVQNEEVQRHARAEAQRKRHADIEEGRRQSGATAPPARRRRTQGPQESRENQQPQAHELGDASQQRSSGNQNIQNQSHGDALVFHHAHPRATQTSMMFPVPGFDVSDPPAPLPRRSDAGNSSI